MDLEDVIILVCFFEKLLELLVVDNVFVFHPFHKFDVGIELFKVDFWEIF